MKSRMVKIVAFVFLAVVALGIGISSYASNGHANCILAVCCPPSSEEQKIALATEMSENLGLTPKYHYETASWIIDNFDLAPKGSLQQFKDSIAKLARENPK